MSPTACPSRHVPDGMCLASGDGIASRAPSFPLMFLYAWAEQPETYGELVNKRGL